MKKNVSEKIIDRAALMDTCGYESMAEEIVKVSLGDIKQSLELLGKAIKAANSADIELYAHRLKGVAMTMGAAKLAERAYSIECAGNEEDIETAASAFDGLKEDAESVMSFLSRDDWIEEAKRQ
jgi:HPt (histidine-containing phosphotransfer) domain-containing protein